MRSYLRVPALIRARLAEFDPDLVHIMYGGVMANLATGAVRDRPTVVTFHGSDLLGEQMAGPVRRRIAAYGVRASHQAARRARGIVVVAEALGQKLDAREVRAEIRLIPCGIDLERFRPLDQAACRQQLNWPADRLHVVFNTNGDDPVKRPALARAAVSRMNDIGVRAELHEMVGLRNDEVPVRFNAADVLLLTSLHEGSPTVVKEALACNLPVVSVDVGDVAQRISGIDGCYLASADPGDLAAKLCRVRDERRRLDARPRMSELSLESTARKLAAFYAKLTGIDAITSSSEGQLPPPGRV